MGTLLYKTLFICPYRLKPMINSAHMIRLITSAIIDMINPATANPLPV